MNGMKVALKCEKCGSQKTVVLPSKPGAYKTPCADPDCGAFIRFNVGQGKGPEQPGSLPRIIKCEGCGAVVAVPEGYSAPQFRCPKCQYVNRVAPHPQMPRVHPAPQPQTPKPMSAPQFPQGMPPIPGAPKAAPIDPSEITNIDEGLLNKPSGQPVMAEVVEAQVASPKPAGIFVGKKSMTLQELEALQGKHQAPKPIPAPVAAPPKPAQQPAQHSAFAPNKTVVASPGAFAAQAPHAAVCSLRQGSGHFARTFTLRVGANIIGRADRDRPSDVSITGDDSISRQSVRLDVVPAGGTFLYKVTVLKSLNPVLHNSKQIPNGGSEYLNINDILQLGNTRLTLVSGK